MPPDVPESSKYPIAGTLAAPTAKAAFQRALAFFRMRRLADAADCCRATLAAEPGHFDALHLLGLLAAQQGRVEEAITLLAKAVESNPGSAEAHSNRGNVRTAGGRYGEALMSYDRALALEPDDVGEKDCRYAR
jgi:tetratricopeptide (TPR) repeat protein